MDDDLLGGLILTRGRVVGWVVVGSSQRAIFDLIDGHAVLYSNQEIDLHGHHVSGRLLLPQDPDLPSNH